MQDEVVKAIRFTHAIHTGVADTDTYFSVDAGWRFEFHGSDVRMTSKTGQVVEVIGATYAKYLAIAPPPAPPVALVTPPKEPAKPRPPFQPQQQGKKR